jgi:N-acetylglucosaminyldiphosphoundecaprenol N-acetyl-beta-D-mannosaminyltransferase
VQVHPVRLEELLSWTMRVIATRQRALVIYANAFAINLAQRDHAFRDAANRADLVFCDGHGVRMASQLLGAPLPERYTPPDWIEQLAERCARKDYHLFFLGALPGVAEAAAARFRARFPGLRITTHHGYFDTDNQENDEVLQRINDAAPDILLVGMGMPRQEIWMVENTARHSVPVVMSVGALFDYLTGQITRGPRWLTDNGWEWLCRLWFEPRRLWRRYLLGNPIFAWRVLRQWWNERRHTQPSA